MLTDSQAGWNKEMLGFKEYARTATSNGLARERSARKGEQIFRKAALVTDAKLRTILDQLERLKPGDEHRPKCSYGCAYCCYQWVRCAVPEALAVVAHIRQTWPQERIEQLITALADYRIEFDKIPPNTISSLCCPVLVDNVCSVYEVRPFICRGCNSQDVEACRIGMEDPEGGIMIPVITPLIAAAGAMRAGMGEGLRDSGLESHDVVFGLAMETALTQPDAIDRYYAGEAVFAKDIAPSIVK
jgi:hypothetical protein